MATNNYIAFPQELFEKYTPQTVYFLMWLINKASHSEELGTVYASTNYLALELNYSPRAVRTIIDLLVSDKVIDKVATKLPTKLATKLIVCDFETYVARPRSSRQSSRQSTDKVRDKVTDKTPIVQQPVSKTSIQDVEIVEEVTAKTPREIEFDNFNAWVDKEVPQVRKVKEQLTIEQFSHLLDDIKIPKTEIISMLKGLANDPKHLKHISVNLTLQNWYNRRQLNYGTRQDSNAAAQQRFADLAAFQQRRREEQATDTDDVPFM